MKIFIVEDNVKIREELSEFLKHYGYEIKAPSHFSDIIESILTENPHLVLLDINLPLYDGYYICREIRKKSDVPIIIVTSRDSEIDELMSMNLGADDFVTKPYNTQILLARIATLLKRAYNSGDSSRIVCRELCLDTAKSVVSYYEKEAELSKNEMKIIYLLMKNEGKIISREEIMTSLWQSDEFVDDNTLTVNINRLRKKLESLGLPDFISTKRGQGYMI